MIQLLTIGLDDDEKQTISDIYYDYRHLMKIIALKYFNDENTAEDIIQDAFFKIKNNLSKINELGCNRKRAYIVNIVKNLCIDYLRKYAKDKRNTVNYDDLSYEIRSTDVLVEDYIVKEELRLELGAIINELDEKDANILKAKYYYGYNTKEICKVLGIKSENTVRSMLSRARRRFAKLMTERDKDENGR